MFTIIIETSTTKIFYILVHSAMQNFLFVNGISEVILFIHFFKVEESTIKYFSYNCGTVQTPLFSTSTFYFTIQDVRIIIF